MAFWRRMKYIGTSITPDAHHQLGLRAAERGLSKAAFLRSLVEGAVATRRTSAATDSAANRTTPRKRKEAA